MRLTTVILIATLMQVSASGFAQRITLNQQKASLEQVLKSIRDQSGYDMIFDRKLVLKAKPVSIQVKEVTISEALEQVLSSQTLSFEIADKTITIKEKTPSFLDLPKPVFANIDARGRVLDENGKPLEGATVVLKGSNRTAKTDVKGEFVLVNVPDDGVLMIRYVGFKTLEISLKDAVMPLEIKLNVATGELEEVKVTYSTGYENIPKERATGSFVQLNNKDLNRTVSTNILDRIVNISSSLRKGIPKASASGNYSDISIRGLSTINANQKPLLVVDGFAYQENDNAMNLTLENLNPNDVESITILRDAAAASIWGARAGNGVIVINTKKGKYNQIPVFQFNSNVNITEKPKIAQMNIIPSKEIVDYEKNLFARGYYNDYDDLYPSMEYFPAVSPVIETLLARRRNEINQADADSRLARYSSHDVREDINKYFLQNSVNQQYNLNIKGGTDKINYYGSFGYDKNISNTIGNKYRRLTLRFDNTFRPLRNLEINTFLVYTENQSTNNGFNYDLLLADGGKKAVPYVFLTDEMGNSLHVPTANTLRSSYIDNLMTPGLLDWHYKPLDELNSNNNLNKLLNGRFGGLIRYRIIPGLSTELSGQFERGASKDEQFYSIDTYQMRDLINKFMYLDALGKPKYPIPLGGLIQNTSSTQTSWSLRGQVNLNLNWKNHSISALSGIEVKQVELDADRNGKYGFDPYNLTFAGTMDYSTDFNLRPVGTSGSGKVPDRSDLSGSLNRYLSYFANATYTFLNKYSVSGSTRIDASNFFGIKANLRNIPLWSVGSSWDICKEGFYNFDAIPRLKMRLTYGYSGNLNNKATALPIINYSPGFSPYNNSMPFASLDVSSPPNPGLTWEKSGMINLGLDFSLKNEIFSGSLEYYTKKGVNLIGNIPLEGTIGALSYAGNYANMKTKGVDLSLHAIFVNKLIKFGSSFSLSYNVEKITNYQLDPQLVAIAGLYLGNFFPVLGKPVFKIYSYKWAGLDPLTGDPLGYIGNNISRFNLVTQGNNTKPEDLVYHGSQNPVLFGNLTNTISYKNLTASFNIVYQLGHYFRKTSINYQALRSNWGGHIDYVSRWKAPGDELMTDVPSLPTNPDGRENFYHFSEILVEKGDNIRLQDIRLEYNIARHQLKLLPFNSASLFIVANNLGVIWAANKDGIDPQSLNGVPSQRSLAFGLNINF